MRIDTTSGAVRGLVHDGVARFLGIPFAAPTVGASRFRYAEPLPAWSEVLDAVTPGPAPIQPPAIGLGMRGATRTAEDCLFLNVFAPVSQTAARRPVFVWIFGGGFIYGDGADPLFDGENLARQQDLVVVTINYRLGIWGFAPLEATNVGLADQVAALQWIQTHITAFGGDPDNVTAVGESAGAMSVCNLLACPAAKGLFHRAIAQSGAADNVMSRVDALETAAVVRANLPGDPADADVATLLAAQRATFERLRGRRASPFRPHLDNEWLPDDPGAVASSGADIPLIIGINKDEHRLYVRPSLQIDDAALAAHVERRLADHTVADASAQTAHVVAHYRTQRPQHPRNPNAAILADIETELRFRRPMLRYAWARGRNTWLYQFDWPSPALNGWLGATHAVEIPFVFGNFEQRATAKFVGAGPDATALSREMMTLWAHFARNGEPPPRWQRFSADDPTQLHLDREIRCSRVDADATVAMWNDVLRLPPV